MALIFNEINQLTKTHYDLLLNADPSKLLIEDYTQRGITYEVITQEKIIGILVLLPTRPETLEIINIAVEPAFQKKGIGQHMLTFAINYSKQHLYRRIEIGTGSTSVGQLYLYQKMGFRITSIDKNFFIHHYTEEIIEHGLVLRDMIRLQFDL